MARKKREEGGGNNAPWLNTFADLMNLLLCFFVLLFSMSSVDAEKFDQISAALSNAIGVFDAGASSLSQGQLISSGMTQLSELSDYFTSMGQTTQKTGEDIVKQNDQTKTENNKNGEGSQEGSESKGEIINQQNNSDSSNQSDSTNESENQNVAETAEQEEIDKALEQIETAMQKVSEKMYDSVSDMTDQYNLGDYVELSIDPEYRFVQMTLKGSILYDSGKAEVKDVAQPILSKIGNILRKFDGYTIEIVGHTDNVPMTTGSYKDNNWLSSARALNAAEYLINQCDINPSKLKYSGRGEYEPISSNATAEGRARNRRIEIKIYNEYSNN